MWTETLVIFTAQSDLNRAASRDNAREKKRFLCIYTLHYVAESLICHIEFECAWKPFMVPVVVVYVGSRHVKKQLARLSAENMKV